MAFGQTVRFHRNDKGFGLNEFAERLGVSPACWSRVEREQENSASATIPPERAAAIHEVKLDDHISRSRALGQPDLLGDIKAVVTLYRRNRDTAKASNKS